MADGFAPQSTKNQSHPETLDLTGCVITIDAMGTQTAIAQQIRRQKGDYILTLKANQGKLYRHVKA